MKRKLLLLDLALLALIVMSGWKLRQEWMAARAREGKVLGRVVKPVPPPPVGASRQAASVVAGTYSSIAQNTLFSKDRNPTVVVETPPPPPPKPMPPLPVFYGVMDLGDGPIAILSEKSGAPNRDYHLGEKIGEFTLVAVNSQAIELEWEGKRIVKKVDELVSQEPPPKEQVAAAAPVRTPARAQVVQATNGPGVNVGSKGMRACAQGDTSPPGTVIDGVRKVVEDTPFGPVCRWEPVR